MITTSEKQAELEIYDGHRNVIHKLSANRVKARTADHMSRSTTGVGCHQHLSETARQPARTVGKALRHPLVREHPTVRAEGQFKLILLPYWHTEERTVHINHREARSTARLIEHFQRRRGHVRILLYLGIQPSEVRGTSVLACTSRLLNQHARRAVRRVVDRIYHSCL